MNSIEFRHTILMYLKLAEDNAHETIDTLECEEAKQYFRGCEDAYRDVQRVMNNIYVQEWADAGEYEHD